MNQLAVYETKGATITPLFDNRKLDLLKNTICKGATNEEFELFLHACQRTGLDPFMRQIYAVKRWDSSLRKETITIQTGIDGYRLIAERTGKYSPGKEPTYQYDDKGNIISATAYVKKQTDDGTWHEVAATAFFNEYCQKTKEGKPTKFWMQLGHAMIAKCAEALALRKAFPGDLSGIYTKEEMLQADIEENVVNPADIQDNSRNSQVRLSEIEKLEVEVPRFITEDEWKQLNDLINKCSDKFQTSVWNKLESLKILSPEEMDRDNYIKFKEACLGHLSKKKNKNEAD